MNIQLLFANFFANIATYMKRLLFPLLSICLGLLLLAIFELSLGLFSGIYQNNSTHIAVYPSQNSDLKAINPDLWTPHFNGFKPSVDFNPIDFQLPKAAHEIRVLVLGGSSVAGFPFAYSNSFCTYLQHNLQILHPDKWVRVFNLGASAISSALIQNRAHDFSDYEADFVIFYLGHNEFMGARGLLSQPGLMRPWSKTGPFLAFIDRLATTHYLKKLLTKAHKSESAKAQTLMEQRSLSTANFEPEQDIAYAAKQLHQNLSNIKAGFDSQTAKPTYLLSSVLANKWDQPPIGSASSQDSLYQNWLQTKQNLSKLEGEADSLMQSFIDHDYLPFRAPSQINKTLKSWAQLNNVKLIELDKALAKSSFGPLPGREFFTDHLHPNHEATLWMAFEFSQAIKGLTKSSNDRAGQALDSSLVLHDGLRMDKLNSFIAYEQLQRLKFSSKMNLSIAEPQAVIGPLEQEIGQRMLQSNSRFSQYFSTYANESLAQKDTLSYIQSFRSRIYWQNRLNKSVTNELIAWASNTQLENAAFLLWPLLDAYGQGPTPELFDLIASCFIKTQHYTNAEQWISHGLAEQPNSVIRNYNMARLKLLMGQQDEAKKYFNRYQQSSKP